MSVNCMFVKTIVIIFFILTLLCFCEHYVQQKETCNVPVTMINSTVCPFFRQGNYFYGKSYNNQRTMFANIKISSSMRKTMLQCIEEHKESMADKGKLLINWVGVIQSAAEY